MHRRVRNNFSMQVCKILQKRNERESVQHMLGPYQGHEYCGDATRQRHKGVIEEPGGQQKAKQA